MQYQEFLEQKQKKFEGVGFTPDDGDLNPNLKPFQAEIVKKACQKGRFALFEECGLGKSFQELEWARLVHQHTGKPILLVCPLAVSSQFVEEAKKFGIADEVSVGRSLTQSDATFDINITNYEKLHKFDPEFFGGIVLDESSILKGFDGKLRKQITEFSDPIPFRLAGTATPSPNDLIELCNHAEFLGVMSGKEVTANFFIQDGNTTNKWRLRKHAHKPFYKFLASWAVAIRSPSDLGFDDVGYVLPPLHHHQIQVKTEKKLRPDALFEMEAQSLSERRKARRISINERTAKAAELVNNSKESWVCWCDLNEESEKLTRAIPDAVEVTGSMSNDAKEKTLKAFSNGDYRVLVSKPSLAGFGLNWQHCHNIVFVGLSDSFEQQYQAIRRCYRFGQEKEVHAYHITAEQEGAVVRNIERKQAQHNQLMEGLTKHVSEEYKPTTKESLKIMSDLYETKEGNKVYLGDAVNEIQDISDESVGLTIFSPPFPGMYAYTNSEHDLGNSKSMAELLKHFSFLASELLRVTKPGRNVCIHLTQEPVFKGKEGYIGLRDFRGELIRLMEEQGFHYFSEITIDKDPQLKAIRTQDHSLKFSQLAKDSAFNRVAMADYLVVFKKPGENKDPIHAGTDNGKNEEGWITNNEWIRWARPVWYASDWAPNGDGIKESDVLNVRVARDDKDERHLCPLQLGVIERCTKLWSNPGDLVFSPFAGIGSEGYKAIELNRKFVGIELKKSYWKVACRNLDHIEETKNSQKTIFDLIS